MLPPALRSFLVFCLVLVFVEARADVPMLARSWQSEDGLPGNAVRAIGQAADGYLWVGTAEGIVRFDGQRFSGFPGETDAKLAQLPVRTIYPHANGEVWVATTRGSLLRWRQGRLQEVRLPSVGEDTTAISQVVPGRSGEVYAVRGAEVWQISDQQVQPVHERTPALEMLLAKDLGERRMHGRADSGGGALLLQDSHDQWWQFTADAKMVLIRPDGLHEPVLLNGAPAPMTRAMCEDREGNIWLGTATQGLWRMRPARAQVWSSAEGLTSRGTLLVLEDSENAIWVASLEHGLDRIAADGVKHYDVGTGSIRRPISALLQTQAGVLWAATRDGQIYRWKDDAFGPPYPANQGPTKVRAIAEDRQGRMWFGGRFGLSSWYDGKLINADLGAQEVVNALIRDDAALWVGTESGRLFRGGGDRFEAATPRESFQRKPISSLLVDPRGGVWVGTMGAGLFYVRDGRVTSLAARMPDADPRITCVLDDYAGHLWLGTLGGICRVEKARLLDLKSAVAVPTLILDRSDGLLTRECTSGGQPAGWRGHDGTLYFSTGHGVARVQPAQVSANTLPPLVVVEEVKANGQPPLTEARKIQAGPGRSRLEFRYTALTFTAPERVSFRIMLEGLDESWRHVGDQRTAAYEAVPPGNYRFRVMAENGDGIWNEVGASLPVEVVPHYWEQRWFQIAVALSLAAFAVAMGALVMRARMRGRLLRLEAQTSREKERSRIAQDLHDNLGASLTEISLLANLAAEEHPSAGQPDETLTEVAIKARCVVGTLDEIVWAVNPRHDTLHSLVEYLAAFGGKFLGYAGIAFRRDIPRELPEAPLDAEQRHNVFLAVREAFNNVVKHAGASEVWLRVRTEHEKLLVSVEDNGRGHAPDAEKYGEGLRGMKTRMQKLGGSCRFESDSSGTRLHLSLPLSTSLHPS